MRAWSYVRVSTDEQITGDGLNRQNRLYLDACALYGWEPAEHQVVDALSGFSGANAQRGGLAKILRAIDNGTIPAGDVLVLELVNFFKVSPLTNRLTHVSALRSLRIFGYEPGSVKEVDHDFVEAVEQVRKEIPGFTF